MKRMLCFVLATILFIPYVCAYGIAHLFKMNDREDMPNAKEWFAIARE